MMPIRIVLDESDLAKLVRGETIFSISTAPRGSGQNREVQIILKEMTPEEIEAIASRDPRAELTRFGSQPPITMSPGELRANSGYLQASGALADSAAYAKAADGVEALEPLERPHILNTLDNGPAQALDIVAEQHFQEIDRSLREGGDQELEEKLSEWRRIILQVIKALQADGYRETSD